MRQQVALHVRPALQHKDATVLVHLAQQHARLHRSKQVCLQLDEQPIVLLARLARRNQQRAANVCAVRPVADAERAENGAGVQPLSVRHGTWLERVAAAALHDGRVAELGQPNVDAGRELSAVLCKTVLDVRLDLVGKLVVRDAALLVHGSQHVSHGVALHHQRRQLARNAHQLHLLLVLDGQQWGERGRDVDLLGVGTVLLQKLDPLGVHRALCLVLGEDAEHHLAAARCTRPNALPQVVELPARLATLLVAANDMEAGQRTHGLQRGRLLDAGQEGDRVPANHHCRLGKLVAEQPNEQRR